MPIHTMENSRFLFLTRVLLMVSFLLANTVEYHTVLCLSTRITHDLLIFFLVYAFLLCPISTFLFLSPLMNSHPACGRTLDMIHHVNKEDLHYHRQILKRYLSLTHSFHEYHWYFSSILWYLSLYQVLSEFMFIPEKWYIRNEKSTVALRFLISE